MENKFEYFNGKWYLESLENKTIPKIPNHYCIKSNESKMEFGNPIATTLVVDMSDQKAVGSISILSYAKELYEILSYIDKEKLIEHDEILSKHISHTLDEIHSKKKIDSSVNYMDISMEEFLELISKCTELENLEFQEVVFGTERIIKEFHECFGNDEESHFNYSSYDILGNLKLELNHYPVTGEVRLVEIEYM